MITFATAHVSMLQNPVFGFLAAVADRHHGMRTRGALSRLRLSNKSTSLYSRKIEGPELRVATHAVARPQGASAPSGINIDDWKIMFGAVTDRLTALVGNERPAASTALQASQKADRLRAEVLDCVDALERLRTAITHEPLPRCAPGSGVSP